MLSALVSTSFDDVSASGRTHSLSETVHFAALTFLGLKCSLHKNLSSLFSIVAALSPQTCRGAGKRKNRTVFHNSESIII